MPKKLDSMIRKVQRSSNVDESSAIAILKSRGLIRQKKSGKGLALTDKGRKSA